MGTVMIVPESVCKLRVRIRLVYFLVFAELNLVWHQWITLQQSWLARHTALEEIEI